MRLIDADALQSEYMKFHDGKRIVLVDVAPTIEPRPEWIPTAERLPEDEQVVLVQDTNGTIWIWKYLGENLEYRGPYQWMDDNEVWQLIDEVVAWMPLPPAYKGEEGDSDE